MRIPSLNQRILERSYGGTATSREAKVGVGAMQRQTARPIHNERMATLLQPRPGWWGPFGRWRQSRSGIECAPETSLSARSRWDTFRFSKKFRVMEVFYLLILKVVGLAGFEPAASSSRTKRSTKLSHSPYQPPCRHPDRTAHAARASDKVRRT